MGSNQSQGRTAAEGLGTSLMTAARDEFNNGPKPYTNPLYAGIGDTTRQGIDQTIAGANASAGGLQNAFNWNNAFLQGGGWGHGQQQAANDMGQVADRLGQPTSTGPSLTEEQLLSVARGEQFGQNAPGYERLRQKALDDAMTNTAAGFLTNGRYGSSVMGDAVGTAATDVLAGMDYTNYQNDIARQERALGAIEGQRQQQFQNDMTQTGAHMAALQSQFGMGQQQATNQAAAAAAMPGYAQALLMPGQATTAAGQLLDADKQAERLADYDLWERTNNARTDHIAKFISMMNGADGMPGTEKETPWWQSMLGGAIGLAGAFA